MPQIIIGGRTVQWIGPGLPTVAFRIAIRAATAEYRPEPISAANLQTRNRIVMMLGPGGGGLAAGLDGLNRLTIAGGNEHSAYIRRDGTLGPPAVGTRGHAPVGTPPDGDVVGFVHTHPVAVSILAPPSADDYGISFQRYPIQLVSEMNGRLWALFEGGYSSLLGSLTGPGQFSRLLDHSTELVYRVVSDGTLRMEAYERGRANQQSSADRLYNAQQALRLQRQQSRDGRVPQGQ